MNQDQPSPDRSETVRPWGRFQSLGMGSAFQVKQLSVAPGQQLSLQRHRHRAEHWIVVEGSARITLEDEVFDLEVNEATFIPLGAIHRIENVQDVPLEIIEVQVGDYLGEDDIERLDDRYGRHEDRTAV